MKKVIDYLKVLFSEPDKRSHLYHCLVYGGLASLVFFVALEFAPMPRYITGLISAILGYGAVFVYGYFREQNHKKHPEKGCYEKRDIIANGIACGLGIIVLPLLLLLPPNLPW